MHCAGYTAGMEMNNTRDDDHRAIQHARMRALAGMASGIAHDFNNSLAVIQGFIELMLMNPASLDDRETTLERLRRMQAAAKKGTETVERMRAFYRKPDFEEVRMPVPLRGLIEEVISTTRPRWREQAMAAGRTIRVEKNIDGEPTVTANRTELRDVLTNLVVNALDAIGDDDDGTVTISARCDETAAVITVGDTGRGMAEDTRRRCFDPHFSTKESAGSGLGLSVARGIVERHGGAIAVRSAPGEGSQFSVRLPATQSAAGAAPSGTPKECRPLTVLVVEDDPDVRLLITTYLADAGHTVKTAANGVGGLERLGNNRFDLVITDLAMPEMPGDRFASSVKRIMPDKPILMLTGFGDMMDTVGDGPPPVDAVLTKPVSKERLLEEVAAVTRTAAGNTDRETPFKGNEHG